MSKSFYAGNKVQVVNTTVGTSQAQAWAGSRHTVSFTVTNDHGSGNVYVGWDDTVSSGTETHFPGGDLATGESLTITDYCGPVHVIAGGAGVNFLAHRIYQEST